MLTDSCECSVFGFSFTENHIVFITDKAVDENIFG